MSCVHVDVCVYECLIRIHTSGWRAFSAFVNAAFIVCDRGMVH